MLFSTQWLWRVGVRGIAVEFLGFTAAYGSLRVALRVASQKSLISLGPYGFTGQTPCTPPLPLRLVLAPPFTPHVAQICTNLQVFAAPLPITSSRFKVRCSMFAPTTSAFPSTPIYTFALGAPIALPHHSAPTRTKPHQSAPEIFSALLDQSRPIPSKLDQTRLNSTKLDQKLCSSLGSISLSNTC